MAAQTMLQLGDFVFAALEIPERLPFGGDQSLIVHKLVGGARVVDAMGADDAMLQWEGWLTGANALDRALYLDTQRKLGQPLVLTWAQLRYQVVIQTFVADYQAVNRIPYRISCVVAEDQNVPVTAIAAPDVDDQMSSDMTLATSLGDSIGDSVLGSLLSGVQTAINAVSSFSNASQSAITTVLQPIAAVQSRVTTLLASTVNATQNVATVGGVLPNNPISVSASALGTQVAAFQSQPNLLNLQSVMGRMSSNLGSVSGNSKTMTTAGGDLYSIAAQQYGDASSWTAIAKANGLSDPALSGINTLTVPKVADTAGGLLGF